MKTAHKPDNCEFPWHFAYEPSPLRLLALLVIYAALWLLLTPYGGLTHDAQAYAFQALAQLDPAVLGQDIFLKYQTQHRFSVFPQIYAALIPAYGLEAPAAALTLAGHVLWYGAAFLVARQLFGTRLGLLCLGLLITVPGPYGGQRVFHMAEPFLTPRLPAEALSLLAIWSGLRGAWIAAILLLVAAFMIHPLMAFPAILLMALLWIDQTWRMRAALPLAAAVAMAGAIVGSVLLGGETPAMSAAWVEVLRGRSGFLFLDAWTPEDWNHTSLSVVTLALASQALVISPGRSIARGAFWLGLTGLVLAAFASEIWSLEVLMQGQPWRWLWLCRFFAVVCLPATLYCAWQSGPAGRAAALLLASAWLVVVPVSAHWLASVIMGSLLATLALAVWSVRTKASAKTQVLLVRGAWAVLALVLVAAAITVSLSAKVVQADLDMPRLTADLVTILRPITPAILIVIVSWAGVQIARSAIATSLLFAGGIALMTVALPAGVESWNRRAYAEDNHAQFADWRAIIPREAEVFWWDSLRETWFLLQRRSYLTLSQGGGLVFSREASAEFRRRAENVREFIDPGYWFNEPHALTARPYPLTAEILSHICRDTALGFVVSADKLKSGAIGKEWPAAGKHLYLYDCDDFRAR
jgi:hypothetical protein